MNYLSCMVEGQSDKALLEGLLTRMNVPLKQVRFVIFQSKQSLKKNLEKRLRGWNTPNTTFLILIDQDLDDCQNLKNELLESFNNARPNDTARKFICIACRALESFYLGDLYAVGKGLNIHRLGRQQDEAKYRNPDSDVQNPAAELKRLTKKYEKIRGTESIVKHLDLNSTNRSNSFKYLLRCIRDLKEQLI